MLKKILALIFCAALLCSFVACGQPPVSTDSDLPSSGSTAGNTDSAVSDPSDKSTDEKDDGVIAFDPDLEHKIMYAGSDRVIYVADLNKAGGISGLTCLEDAVIWEWDPKECANIKYPERVGAAGLKVRHSEYWDTDVILLAESNGWVGVVSYETKELLFEQMLNKGPHCIELMPNGDMVVASSGNGEDSVAGLYYFPLSTGAEEKSDFTPFKGAHGVCYDPENECLWALGDDEVRYYTVLNYGKADAKLKWVQGEGDSLVDLEDIGGHNLAPVYGQPGKYWVTSIKAMYLFDSSTGKLSKTYKDRKELSYACIKGIAYFADGTAVQSGYVGEGGDPEYMSTAFRIITLEETSGKVSSLRPVTREIPFETEGFQVYKVQTFNTNYQ